MSLPSTPSASEWRHLAERIPTLCINLPRAVERREAMVAKWSRFLPNPFPFPFHDAIDRRDIDSGHVDKPPAASRIGRPLSTGEIACLMSHIAAAGRLLDWCGSDGVLVMEDDITPIVEPHVLWERIHTAKAQAPAVDIILCCKPDNEFTVRRKTRDLLVPGEKYPYGTTMLWMSREGTKDFVTHLQRFDAPADYWVDFCHERRLGVLRNPVATHNRTETFVGNLGRGREATRRYFS